MLDTHLKDSTQEVHDALLKSGQVLDLERQDRCYALFRQRFGPEVLSNLEGKELLQLLHGRPSKDSLVYWLEFKNDGEFPAKFGSIAGGSSLKFGLYWNQKTSSWITGDPRNQTPISTEEAIGIATKQRDGLLAASRLLTALPALASDSEYAGLQEQLEETAPAVSGYGWAHKYLSCLFPEKLDTFHNEGFQRFYLVSLLQEPPAQNGLYICAGRFVKIANGLDMSLNHLANVLTHRIPKPRRYWRIGTQLAEEESIWTMMKGKNCVAIGWAEIGDLAGSSKDKDFREKLKTKLGKFYPDDPRTASRKAGEIQNFATGISKGDFVLAAEGSRILGLGRVTGPYRYDPADESGAPHQRLVEWKNLGNWELPETQGLRTTVYEIDGPKNLIEIERRAAFPSPAFSQPSSSSMPETEAESLPLNIILYGPPGTGKTYHLRNEYMEKYFTERQAVLSPEEQNLALVKEMAWWEVVALALLDSPDHRSSVTQILEHPLVQARLKLSANKNPRAMLWASLQTHTKKDCPTVNYTTRIDPLLFSKDTDSFWSIDAKLAEVEAPYLDVAFRKFQSPSTEVAVVCRYKFTTFHQSFSYEDFVEGIKPHSEDGQLSYEVRDGIFKTACQEAAANPGKPYGVFIDEINRGNVASIFGELITLIEDDKRVGADHELTAELPYSRQTFGVPKNLHIIGTMNTADRSVEALDTALRRRFTFREMRPDPTLIKQPLGLGVDLRQLLVAMNIRIEQLLDHDHCIGHAYFMSVTSLAGLRAAFANKILPLLREYFFGNPSKVGLVLGERFVKPQSGKTPFASGSWGEDELDEKEVFVFADVFQLTEADFQTIYAQAHSSL